MSDPVDITVARIEGHLKTLEAKMDGNHDLLMTQVEATRRESDQVIRWSQERLENLAKEIARQQADMDTDRKTFKELVNELREEVVTRDQFEPIRKTVYFVMAIVGASVVGAVLISIGLPG